MSYETNDGNISIGLIARGLLNSNVSRITCHSDFLSRSIWLGCFYSAKKAKGNWHTKSSGRIGGQYCNDAFKRFPGAGFPGVDYCNTCIMVGRDCMAAEFCLSHQH